MPDMLLCDKYRIYCLCESVLQFDKYSMYLEQGKEITSVWAAKGKSGKVLIAWFSDLL